MIFYTHPNLLHKIIFILFFLCLTSNLQAQETITIVAFGNSTTAPRKGIDKVYAQRVNENLTNSGINNIVINSGIGGSHTGSIKDNNKIKIEHAMDRFQKNVLDYHPQWVTLDFGLNDSWQDHGKDSASRIPINEFSNNLSYFIDKIKLQNGKVILLTPNPIGQKYEKWRYNKVKEYKKVTKKLAKEKKIYWINSWKLFYSYTKKKNQKIDSLLLDGIHPNDIGHQLISDAITKIIRKAEKH